MAMSEEALVRNATTARSAAYGGRVVKPTSWKILPKNGLALFDGDVPFSVSFPSDANVTSKDSRNILALLESACGVWLEWDCRWTTGEHNIVRSLAESEAQPTHVIEVEGTVHLVITDHTDDGIFTWTHSEWDDDSDGEGGALRFDGLVWRLGGRPIDSSQVSVKRLRPACRGLETRGRFHALGDKPTRRDRKGTRRKAAG